MSGARLSLPTWSLRLASASWGAIAAGMGTQTDRAGCDVAQPHDIAMDLIITKAAV
jgi:hypothetical protein